MVHCSATPPFMDIGVGEIRRWHLGRGWSDVGYHFVVRRDGRVELGRSVSKTGAHVRGYNVGSIGVCYVGGVDAENRSEDNRTEAQKVALRSLLRVLRGYHSDATIHGHNEFSEKDCPCFDVGAEYKDL